MSDTPNIENRDPGDENVPSRKEIMDELRRCAEDADYFIERHVSVKTKEGTKKWCDLFRPFRTTHPRAQIIP